MISGKGSLKSAKSTVLPKGKPGSIRRLLLPFCVISRSCLADRPSERDFEPFVKVDRGVKNLEKRFGVIGGGFLSFLLCRRDAEGGGEDPRYADEVSIGIFSSFWGESIYSWSAILSVCNSMGGWLVPRGGRAELLKRRIQHGRKIAFSRVALASVMPRATIKIR